MLMMTHRYVGVNLQNNAPTEGYNYFFIWNPLWMKTPKIQKYHTLIVQNEET